MRLSTLRIFGIAAAATISTITAAAIVAAAATFASAAIAAAAPIAAAACIAAAAPIACALRCRRVLHRSTGKYSRLPFHVWRLPDRYLAIPGGSRRGCVPAAVQRLVWSDPLHGLDIRME